MGPSASSGEKLELDQLLRDLDLFNEPQNDEKSPSNNQEITKEPLNRENQLENDLELLFGKVQQEQEEHLDRNEQIINEEKNLFQRIFTSYIDSEPKESPENILKGINQPTFRSSRIHSVSEKIRDDARTRQCCKKWWTSSRIDISQQNPQQQRQKDHWEPHQVYWQSQGY